MKINSAAGEFEFEVTGLELEDKDLVLVGTMGVWEARTVIESDEITRVIALMLRSRAFWRLVPRLPGMLLQAMFNPPKAPTVESSNV